MSSIATQLLPLLHEHSIMRPNEHINRVGLRVVAPGSYFLQDRQLDQQTVQHLKDLATKAPLHLTAMLSELEQLQQLLPDATFIGLSDSAFHAHKPDRAWNYGLPLEDADRFEIKRYGYHGLSVGSIIDHLQGIGKLTPRIIVAHLGSGASITAVYAGQGVDTTMGYSPLEGLVMATRSGSIDLIAAQTLQRELQLNEAGLADYLQHKSGLQGLGGSPDIRELLQRESNGDHRAQLALDTYVYNIQKAIGQMTAALGGLDLLVFTGTVGERSAPIRQRIISQQLQYLDLELNDKVNALCVDPQEPTNISRQVRSKPIFVIPTQELGYMANLTEQFVSQL